MPALEHRLRRYIHRRLRIDLDPPPHELAHYDAERARIARATRPSTAPCHPAILGHMSAQAQAILEQALRLSADERAHLVDELQRSLEDGASGLPSDDVALLWNEEIKRRLARARERVARGEPTGRSADEVYADAEARIQAIRATRGR